MLNILVPLYPILLFYIAINVALAIVTNYLSKRLLKYVYLTYLSRFYWWCTGFGLGYMMLFSESTKLQFISYLLFFIAFLGSLLQLVLTTLAVANRKMSFKQQTLFLVVSTILFISLIAIDLPILLNLTYSSIGLIASVWFWKNGGLFRLIGPLIFAINAVSLIYVINQTAESLQIQILLTSIFRISLSITLVAVAISQADHERQQIEEKLRQSEKMDALGQLSGGVAHDFNNMLGGIIGSAEILGLQDLSSEDNKFVNIIITAATRASDLTKKLLTFSRKGGHTIEHVDINSIVNDTIAILRRTIDKRISINFENNATSSFVGGDSSQLQNAFLNMGINASHAMPEGGTLTFSLFNEELSDVYCQASSFSLIPGNYIEITITDSGAGMTPEIQKRIFEPFFTTKGEGKGTGLGLAAVYGMVQEHKGAITVYSQEGVGTTFHIYLPLLNGSEIKNKVKNLQLISGSGTILVIDDEELIRITLKAQLTSLGYKVIVAENGKQGFELFQEEQSTIDMVILDMIMPEMNGPQTLAAIREINTEIPVFISSGFSKEDDLEKIEHLGFSRFLHKPFRISELSQVLKDVSQDK